MPSQHSKGQIAQQLKTWGKIFSSLFLQNTTMLKKNDQLTNEQQESISRKNNFVVLPPSPILSSYPPIDHDIDPPPSTHSTPSTQVSFFPYAKFPYPSAKQI